MPEVGPGVVGHVLRSAEQSHVPIAKEDMRFDPSVDKAPGYVVTSIICAPVIGSNGMPLAAVQLCNKVKDRRQQARVAEPFNADDIGALGLLCSILGPALERQLLLDRDF